MCEDNKKAIFQAIFTSKSYDYNFSFLLLTESGISFCPEKSVRFGGRAPPEAGRDIDFSYVVPRERLELSRLASRALEARAFANSATWAFLIIYNNYMIIASTSGIRFTTDEPMEVIAARYARAFAQDHRGKIVVGRDSRPTGKKIAAVIIEILKESRCAPIDLGIVPTPTLTMALVKLKAVGGIMITASHNPAEWNGLKLFGSDGIYLRNVLTLSLS